MLLLLLSQGGYQVFFAIRQHGIKEDNTKRLLAGLPVSMLDAIDADQFRSEIKWEEEGREFYLHGELYDVAYTRIIKGKKIIYCLNDTREEQLLERLAGIAAGQSQQDQRTENQAVSFYHADFILDPDEEPACLEEDKTTYAIQHTNLISATADIPTAPPD